MTHRTRQPRRESASLDHSTREDKSVVPDNWI
jgi:hypothetical protein